MEGQKEENSLSITDNIKEYNDQEEKQDSLSQKMDKMYQENKNKKAKINRPVSSYHKNENSLPSSNIKQEQNKKSHPKKAELPPKSYEELSSELSQHLINNKITKSAFIGSVNAYYTIEDFKELLASFRYNIPKKYLQVLFNNEGVGLDGEFLNIKKFADKINFFIPDNSPDYSINNLYKDKETNNSINSSKLSINNSGFKNKAIKCKTSNDELPNIGMINNRENTISNKINNNNTLIKSKRQINKLEMNALNEEFSKFNKDIYQIIKTEGNIPITNRRPKINNFNANQSRSNYPNYRNPQKIKNLPPPISTNSNIINSPNKNLNMNNNIVNLYRNLIDEPQSSSIENMLQSQTGVHPNDLIIRTGENTQALAIKNIAESNKRTKIEEKEIKDGFKKEKRDFVDFCKIKINELNSLCNEMGEKKYYVLNEENEEDIKCNIFMDRSLKKLLETITLKGVVIHWELLKNKYLKKDENIYCNNNEAFAKDNEDNENNVEKLLKQKEEDENERLKEVKEVLISTVKLKTKLKTQLESLQKKIILDENVVVDFLKRVGVEFPEDMSCKKKDN